MVFANKFLQIVAVWETICLAFSFSSFAVEKLPALEEVDRVLRKAESVQGLLDKGERGQGFRNAYFEALKKYFNNPGWQPGMWTSYSIR